MASAAINRLLNAQRAQLFGLTEIRGVKRLKPIYEKARLELQEELAGLVRRGEGKSFTAHHMRVVLIQVTGAIRSFQDALGEHLSKNQKIASTLAQRHVIDAAKSLSRQFEGHTPILQIEEAGVLRGIDRKITPSLLERYEVSARLYGPPVIEKVKDQLALSLVQSDTVDRAVDRVAGTDGIFAGQRWRAERIVRTELANAFHAVQYKTMDELRTRDMPDLGKTLISTFDGREGNDAREQHMQIRKLHQPFLWHVKNAHGVATGEVIEYQHPPNRPHDRSVMIPWRDGWPKSSVADSPGAVQPRSV